MATKDIRPSTAIVVCDVCGRTLLRGERAEIYVGGGVRRSVCELCTSRALHGGWVREGEVAEYDESSARPDRRRSLFGRRRKRDGRAGQDTRDAREPLGAGEERLSDDMPAPEPMFEDEAPRWIPGMAYRRVFERLYHRLRDRLATMAADPHDSTVEELVTYYRGVSGEHPDWDDYRAAMVRDRRRVVTFAAEHAYGQVGG